MKHVAYQWEVTITYKIPDVKTRSEGVTFGDPGLDWRLLWR